MSFLLFQWNLSTVATLRGSECSEVGRRRSHVIHGGGSARRQTYEYCDQRDVILREHSLGPDNKDNYGAGTKLNVFIHSPSRKPFRSLSQGDPSPGFLEWGFGHLGGDVPKHVVLSRGSSVILSSSKERVRDRPFSGMDDEVVGKCFPGNREQMGHQYRMTGFELVKAFTRIVSLRHPQDKVMPYHM
ncbi:hypothetical protein BXZ70DRAFT_910524 [Cristinia sonorae]|uniref:Uncharacterized protein n=1 Tax=Cristinia sonorae TaxID=1940300 RepID=A0A8K0UGC6_9AGAR|nr:hypothetical protein BXZ70DRAFT_910524 [Cristinia sonorae]